MFRKLEKEIYLEEFILPFEGKNANNRWVKLSKIIPWATIENRYAKLFPKKTWTESQTDGPRRDTDPGKVKLHRPRNS